MRRWLATGLAVLMLVLAMPRADANPHLRRAKRLLDAFKERQALRSLRKAARWGRNTPALQAEVALYQGIALFNLLKIKAAKRSFQRALKLDPQLVLPARGSPKIRRFVERIRASMPPPAAKPTPPPPAPTPPPPEDGPELSSDQPKGPREPPVPKTADGLADNSAGESSAVTPPDDTAEATASKGGINWGGWICLGVAVAAGGAGLGFALSAKSAQTDADNLEVPWLAADIHYRNAKDRALFANIAWGVAGAAAIASTVFFIAGGKKKHKAADGLSGSIVPAPGGAVLQVGGVLP